MAFQSSESKNILIEAAVQLDNLTDSIGISTRRKLIAKDGENNDKEFFNFRLVLVLVTLCLDLCLSIHNAFVPLSDEEKLLKYGDFGYHIVESKRHIFTFITLGYRLNALLNVVYLYRNDFRWLRNADRLYSKLTNAKINEKCTKLARYCRRILLISSVSLTVPILLTFSITTYVHWQRNQKYQLYFAYVYMVFYSVVPSMILCYFLVQLYFYCRLLKIMFENLNQQMQLQLSTEETFTDESLNGYLRRFGMQCEMLSHVNTYIKPIYALWLFCTFPIVSPMFYAVFYTDIHIVVRSMMLGFMANLLGVLLYFSHLIGLVELKAKMLANQFYQKYNVIDIAESRTRTNDSKPKSSKLVSFKLLQYFQVIFESNLCITIFGNLINTSTTIKIMTTFLTFLAFMMERFRRN